MMVLRPMMVRILKLLLKGKNIKKIFFNIFLNFILLDLKK